MWKEKYQEIVEEKKLYDESVNFGATEKEIQMFVEKVRAEIDVELPHEYLRLLELVDGLEFNGFILYGIDHCLLLNEQNQSIYGLIEYNKIWYENDWQKNYLFLGESNISWFVYDLDACKYIELDNPSGRENTVFNNFDSMLERFFSDSLISYTV